MLIQAQLWHWFALLGFVALLLGLDLGLFHRAASAATPPTLRQSLGWTAFWILLALGFDGLLWRVAGAEAAARFLSGYLVEWSLSIDNVFVFALVFSYFGVPREHQYRVLFWGVVGAIGMRLAMVLLGARLIAAWDWVLPLLGLAILYLAVQLLRGHGPKVDPERNPLLRLARRLLPISPGDHGQRLIVREQGHWRFTRLMLALVAVECADVMMAIDSVPAIFGVTRDPFIVFSSNVMAILGLRALYFLVADVMGRLRYLNIGLSAVLAFIGLSMVAEYASHRFCWLEPGRELVPYWMSLVAIAAILAATALASWLAGNADENKPQISQIRADKGD